MLACLNVSLTEDMQSKADVCFTPCCAGLSMQALALTLLASLSTMAPWPFSVRKVVGICSVQSLAQLYCTEHGNVVI
jgi:hypothetical protein